MSRLSPRARRRIGIYEEQAAERFDATVISNVIYDRLAEDEQLIQLIEAAAATESAARSTELAADTRETGDGPRDLYSAVEIIHGEAQSRVEDVVDNVLSECLKELDEYGDVLSEEEIEEAKQEARAYLNNHKVGSEEADR